MSTSHDFRIEDHGSLVLLFPLTDAGQAWVGEYLSGPEVLRHAGAVVIEPRYVGGIVEGFTGDGLTVAQPAARRVSPAFPASARRAFNNRHED